MYLVLLATALNFQCFLHYVQKASGVEIKKDFSFYHGRQTKKQHLEILLKKIWNNGEPNSTILALSWMESRLRPFVRRGDAGQACGTFQIHARHSYPMFRRKSGYRNWKPKSQKHKRLVNQECRKLETLDYSINTLEKYLDLFNKHKKHPCHHNSGIKGKCNLWYKKRLNYFLAYFELSKTLCKNIPQHVLAKMYP